MTKFQNDKFSVNVGGPAYSNGWERIFGCSEQPEPETKHVTINPGDLLLTPGDVAQMTTEFWDADREPLQLGKVQRRVREWAEHNFPLKVTEEHQRIAREHIRQRYACIDLRDMHDLAKLIASREFRSHRPLLGACEEIGELCHAHLKNEQGIRGTPEEWLAKKKDAIGDVLIYLLDYCNKEDLDIEECLQVALDEISTRDWIRFPKNGKTE